MALTQKQEMFLNAYLATFNATEAARQAKYKGNDETLASVGWENLRKPEIAEAISRRLQESAMSADEVLMRLAEHARGDMGHWLSDSGEIDIAAMKREKMTRLLRKVKRTQRSGETEAGGTWEETRVEVELHDAQSALALLGKHHKLFTDVSETKAEVEIVDATDPRERIRSRIAGIAQRNAMGRSPERPDPAGGDSP